MTAARQLFDNDVAPSAPPPVDPSIRRFMARCRRALRAIEVCTPLEARIVSALVEGGAGGGGPWRADVVRRLAHELGLSMTVLQAYLGAVRRTLGLPVVFLLDTSGPLVRDEAWIRKARATGDWGPFQALLAPGWSGGCAVRPHDDGRRKRWATRLP